MQPSRSTPTSRFFLLFFFLFFFSNKEKRENSNQHPVNVLFFLSVFFFSVFVVLFCFVFLVKLSIENRNKKFFYLFNSLQPLFFLRFLFEIFFFAIELSNKSKLVVGRRGYSARVIWTRALGIPSGCCTQDNCEGTTTHTQLNQRAYKIIT